MSKDLITLLDECRKDADGFCELAGTEECELECPFPYIEEEEA